MAEPVFKLLRCDAEASHMLGWAKKEVRRLVDFARLDAFNRTWKFGDVSVRAQYFGGVARLELEAEAPTRGWAITKIVPPQIGKTLYVEPYNQGVNYLTRAVYEDGAVAAEVQSTYVETVIGYNPETGQPNAWHSEWTGFPLQDQGAMYRAGFSGAAMYVENGSTNTYLGSTSSISRIEIAPEGFVHCVADVSSSGSVDWGYKVVASVVNGTSTGAGFALFLAHGTQVWTGTGTDYYAVSGITSAYNAPLPVEVGQISTSTVEYVLFPATLYPVAVNDYEGHVWAARKVVQGTRQVTLVSRDENGDNPVYAYAYSRWVDAWAQEGTKVYDDAWADIGGWKYITEFAVQDLGAYAETTAIQPWVLDIGFAAQYASEKQWFRVFNDEKRYAEAKEKSDIVVERVNTSSLPVSVVQAIREARPASTHVILDAPMLAEVVSESTDIVSEGGVSPTWSRVTTTTRRTIKLSYEYTDEQGEKQAVEQLVPGEKSVVQTTHYLVGSGVTRTSTVTAYTNWLDFKIPEDFTVGSTGAPLQWIFVRDSYDTGIAEVWDGQEAVVGDIPYGGTAPPELFGGVYYPPLPTPGDTRIATHPQILYDYRTRYKPKYRLTDTATDRPWQDSLFKHGEQVSVFLLSTLDAVRGDVGLFILDQPRDKVCYGWATYSYDYDSGGFTWVSYKAFTKPVVLAGLAQDYNCIVRFLNIGWKDIQEQYQDQAKELRETLPEARTPEQAAYIALQQAVSDALTPRE